MILPPITAQYGMELGPLNTLREFDDLTIGFGSELVREHLLDPNGYPPDPEEIAQMLYPHKARLIGRECFVASRFSIPERRIPKPTIQAIVRTPLHPYRGVPSGSFLAIVSGPDKAQVATVTVSLLGRQHLPRKTVSPLRLVASSELEEHIYVRTHTA